MTSIFPAQCYGCARLDRSVRTSTGVVAAARCEAYPQGIPEEIGMFGADHRTAMGGETGGLLYAALDTEQGREAFGWWQRTFNSGILVAAAGVVSSAQLEEALAILHELRQRLTGDAQAELDAIIVDLLQAIPDPDAHLPGQHNQADHGRQRTGVLGGVLGRLGGLRDKLDGADRDKLDEAIRMLQGLESGDVDDDDDLADPEPDDDDEDVEEDEDEADDETMESASGELTFIPYADGDLDVDWEDGSLRFSPANSRAVSAAVNEFTSLPIVEAPEFPGYPETVSTEQERKAWLNEWYSSAAWNDHNALSREMTTADGEFRVVRFNSGVTYVGDPESVDSEDPAGYIHLDDQGEAREFARLLSQAADQAQAATVTTAAVSTMPPQLQAYWLTGEGAAKVRWCTPGSFRRARRLMLKEGVPAHMVDGTVANLYRKACGKSPGRHRGETGLTGNDLDAHLQHNQQDHAGDASPGADKLKLAGRIGLGPGQKLVSSRKVTSSDNASAVLARIEGPDGPELRVGVVWDEDARRWGAANKGGTVKLDAAGIADLRTNMATMIENAQRLRKEHRDITAKMDSDDLWDRDRSDGSLTDDQRTVMKRADALYDGDVQDGGVLASGPWGDLVWQTVSNDVPNDPITVRIDVRPNPPGGWEFNSNGGALDYSESTAKRFAAAVEKTLGPTYQSGPSTAAVATVGESLDAQPGELWHAVVHREGVSTGKRTWLPGSVEWREPPFAAHHEVISAAHGSSPVTVYIGNVTRVVRDGPAIHLWGDVDLGSEQGMEWARRLVNGYGGWPSFGPGSEAIEYDVVHAPAGPLEEPEQVLFRRYRMGETTFVSVPGQENTFVEALPALIDAMGAKNVTTAGAGGAGNSWFVEIPNLPPAEWFEEPEEYPYGYAVTMLDDGHLFGLIAPHNEAHRTYARMGERRTLASLGKVDFSRWARETIVEGGKRVLAGPLTMECMHAPKQGYGKLDRRNQYYEDSCSIFARIAVGNAKNGEGHWLNGAAMPGVSAEQVLKFLACGVSGDWQPHPNKPGWVELVAVLAVPAEGWPKSKTGVPSPVTRIRETEHGAIMVASAVPTRFEPSSPAVDASVMYGIAAAAGVTAESRVRAEAARIEALLAR